jgi:serralysin
MLFDVYELQQLYGANSTTRTGNTTYGFGSTAGPIYAFLPGSAPQYCIWDAGGIDTLDCSGYSQAQTIDLNQGTYSSIGGGVGNISIAIGATIENAIGGSGNDILYGNAADNAMTGGSGNDTFTGGGGNDTIDGGAGWDTTNFNTLFSNATIVPLASGGWTVTAAGQTETLINVEAVEFTDCTVALRQQWLHPASQSASIADPTPSIDPAAVLLFTQGGDPASRDPLSTAVIPDLVYRGPTLPDTLSAATDTVSTWLTHDPRGMTYT